MIFKVYKNLGCIYKLNIKGLFNLVKDGEESFPLYLLANKKYLLFLWIMTPHKKEKQKHSMLELL